MIENYSIDRFGVIHQNEKNIFTYDKNYVVRSYGNLKLLTDEMAYMRLGFIIGAIGFVPKSILDVGYGTGDFLKVSKKIIKDCYGHDLFNDLIPDGCRFVDSIFDHHYDVITFFDSLEHHPDINFIDRLNADYVVITVPWCHYPNDNWFQNWKHRKPDEHLHHFNKISLSAFMSSKGYDLVTYANVEDTIRKPVDDLPNILTAVYMKRTK